MAKSHGTRVRWGALFVLGSVLIVESAFADVPPGAVPSVTVQYQDLDLNDPKNVATLYHRLRRAAVRVCKPTEGPQLVNRVFWISWNSCFDHAIANAVDRVHNEKLSAYYAKHIRSSKRAWVDAPVTAER